MRYPRDVEVPIVGMLKHWLEYRDHYSATSENGIGADYVLGPEWAAIGMGIRGLLNGDCGRLDCGSIDTGICDVLITEGFDPDNIT